MSRFISFRPLWWNLGGFFNFLKIHFLKLKKTIENIFEGIKFFFTQIFPQGLAFNHHDVNPFHFAASLTHLVIAFSCLIFFYVVVVGTNNMYIETLFLPVSYAFLVHHTHGTHIAIIGFHVVHKIKISFSFAFSRSLSLSFAHTSSIRFFLFSSLSFST